MRRSWTQRHRARQYWFVGLGLVALQGLLLVLPWRSNASIHIGFEVASATVAAVVGAFALMRHYIAEDDGSYLLLGTGLLGTASLDAYHAVVTSPHVAHLFPSGLVNLLAWSWTSSRVFLSLLLLASWATWNAGRVLRRRWLAARFVYLGALLATAATFAFFAFTPLPSADISLGILHRPGDLVPGAVFCLVLVLNLRKGAWKANAFEHWLVLSLIFNAAASVLFMPLSRALFDQQFDGAHGLKWMSYACLLAGMFEETARALRSERLRAQELQDANRELEQFAYIASHDLQEPLRTVTNYSQLLDEEFEDALGDSREYVDFIVEGSARLRALLGGLLAYSRLGTAPRHWTEFPLQRAVEAAQRVATGHSPKLRVEVEPLPTVVGDEGQVSDLFRHLFDNASKFHGQEPPSVRICAHREESVWTVSVQDNGIGLAPTQSGRIFRLFQRLHPREKYPGIGLGLTLCRRIVEAHGGRIGVESQPGSGSVFQFTLAVQPNSTRSEYPSP